MDSILPVELKRSVKAEFWFHALFWGFIFSAVNVSWSENWFDPLIRPNTPAPLSVILFPVLFYAHAFWAFPRFFKQREWFRYGLSLIFIFLVPELLRLGMYTLLLDKSPSTEWLSRDSLIFGIPSAVWLSFLTSTGYMITRDWFHIHAQNPPDGSHNDENSLSYEKQLLTIDEADTLIAELGKLMESSDPPYKNPNYTLRDAAGALGTTDKKLSALLNRHMNTGFNEYINRLRISAFLEGSKQGELDRLSITGFALKCGFSSKTSFYRAFKKETGCTPTQYLSNPSNI